MKRAFAVFCFVLALSLSVLAQTPPKPAAPKSDADIQKCIAEKFASSEKLKSQGFTAKVSGGEATLTGTANNAGSKGAATGIAKRCGASKVTNNITSPPVSNSKKSGDAKPAEKKN